LAKGKFPKATESALILCLTFVLDFSDEISPADFFEFLMGEVASFSMTFCLLVFSCVACFLGGFF